MGIPVLRGRDIVESDRERRRTGRARNRVLGRELWPGQDPVGHKLILGAGVPARVIGVVKDIHQEGLDAAPKPEFNIWLVVRAEIDATSIVNGRAAGRVKCGSGAAGDGRLEDGAASRQ
jgi:hypothetical protein